MGLARERVSRERVRHSDRCMRANMPTEDPCANARCAFRVMMKTKSRLTRQHTCTLLLTRGYLLVLVCFFCPVQAMLPPNDTGLEHKMAAQPQPQDPASLTVQGRGDADVPTARVECKSAAYDPLKGALVFLVSKGECAPCFVACILYCPSVACSALTTLRCRVPSSG